MHMLTHPVLLRRQPVPAHTAAAEQFLRPTLSGVAAEGQAPVKPWQYLVPESQQRSQASLERHPVNIGQTVSL